MPAYAWRHLRFRLGRKLLVAPLLAAGVLALGGCAATPEARTSQGAASRAAAQAIRAQDRPRLPDTVSLLSHGWHTDIAMPVSEISGPLLAFAARFPGAETLVIGYGKRTFMIAPAHSIGEWIIGPFPGPAALEVSALNAPPALGYGSAHTITLPISEAGAARLSTFLWQAFAKTPAGEPRFIAQGNFPGSLFYDAARSYRLTHTCNTWSAEALAAAGLPIHPAGVIFAGPLDRAARRIARENATP